MYRKILSEYNNRNNISHTITYATIATFNVTIAAKKLKGYIQNYNSSPDLTIYCFMEKQLECIHKTEYDDRILHVHATGSLVKINERQDANANLNRILSYFCLMVNKSYINLETNDSKGASHPMKRLTNSFKPLRLTEAQTHYACYCFSLLLNSTNLANIFS